MKAKRKIQHVEYANLVQNSDSTGTFDIIKIVKFMTDSQKLDLIIKEINEIKKRLDFNNLKPLPRKIK